MKSIKNKPITYGHVLKALTYLALAALWCAAFWGINNLRLKYEEDIINETTVVVYQDAYNKGYAEGKTVENPASFQAGYDEAIAFRNKFNNTDVNTYCNTTRNTTFGNTQFRYERPVDGMCVVRYRFGDDIANQYRSQLEIG